MSTVLLFALDNTIVATIQPTIVDTFGQQQNLAWIGISFVLGQSLILPMYVPAQFPQCLARWVASDSD